MTIDVETVLTEAQLDAHMGGLLLSHTKILPASVANSSAIRTDILRMVLKHLARRTPPIREEDIADPTELRDAVTFGSCGRLYEIAMTSGGESEPFFYKWKAYETKFKDELNSLQVTTTTLERARNSGPSIMRR